ncbi:MAG: dihydrofolate reductase [Patescibacteria group bacterium]
MKIIIIAAMDKNGVIGKEGEMPWHFPEDLKHFKKTTMGKFVIMGRKTYLSLPGKLEGRKVIVLSRNKNFSPSGVKVVNSIERALKIAEGEVYIAGGASIYSQFMNKADEIMLTVIDKSFNGDTYFPDFKEKNWKLVEEKKGNNKLLTFKKYKSL